MEENPLPLRLSNFNFVTVVNDNDRDLIEGCRQGDHDAFAVLFEQHKDKIYSIALRYAGNETAAMDIAQDAFLKLLTNIRQFRSDSRFDTWLYRLVVNSCLDYQRRKRRWTPIFEGLLDAVLSRRETVLHELLREEITAEVQQTVNSLPPDQRIAIILRYTEGLSYEEVAEITGVSKGTVSSRLNRAHKLLEKRLAHLRKEGGYSA